MSRASNAAEKIEPPPVVDVSPRRERDPASPARTPRVIRTPEKLCRVLSLVGLGFLVPLIRMAGGEDPRIQLRDLWRTLGVPLAACCVS